ncbi:hypothetical protein BE21_02585 [Sorangium cellulosum]|uniref:Uncharacterized protein n=1 Tax=Sorangium cellulosum TaxID=56 RepID=A0A150TSD2_SORCE|nr:hypothetical protein BE21_02585 [Sorangium cellulosum]
MTSKFLPVIALNAFEEGAELLPLVTGGTASQREVLRFCRTLRRRAICELLLLGLVGRFHLYLHKSGRAFLHFLRGSADAAKVTSRAEPFFDAIACLDLECAREQARSARSTWNERVEYEEDFLYVRFLMSAHFLDAPATELTAMLARAEEVTEGRDDPRIAICSALLARDAGRFDDALSDLLDLREQRTTHLFDRGGAHEEEAATEGQIDVEGLALVRLAESRGIVTRPEYPFIPSLLRVGPTRAFTVDDWTDIAE